MFRQLLVQNEHTPIHILEKLANDENSSVRRVLASYHNNTPIHILKKLANDRDNHVRGIGSKSSKYSNLYFRKIS